MQSTAKSSDWIIAGHTLGTPDHTPAEAIRLFAEAGLGGAELIWQDGYRSGIPETANRTTLDEIRCAVDETGIRVVGLTPYMSGINSLDEDVRSRDLHRFRSCLNDAAALGAGVVRVYAGAYTPEQSDERSALWDRLVASLRELAPSAAEHEITLVVENHFNTMTVTAQETADLIATLDSPAVRVLYDQANLTFTHSEDAEEALRIQGPLIAHVHAKDLVFVDRDRPFSASAVATVAEDQRAVRSRVLGDGELDWPAIVAGLLRGGYTEAFSLEYEYRWHPQDLPDPLEGFRRGGSRLRALLDAAATAVTG